MRCKTNSILLNLLVISTPVFVISAEETCPIDNKSDCSSQASANKYSKARNQRHAYLKAIEAAKASYEPCEKPGCECHAETLNDDLKPFQGKGVSEGLINGVGSKGTKYQIIGGRLFRDKECMFPARCSGVEHFLLEVAPEVPDVEFVLNTRDWPQIHRSYGPFGPVFSFSKTKDYYDIMYPAWAFWEGGPAIGLYPTGIGRWDKHRSELGKIANETSWSSKKNQAFFRGSRTSSERDALVLLSRQRPDLVDAQYTKNQAWKSDEDTLNRPPAAEVPFGAHCAYKYLFNFRGVAASFRFKHLLLCKSLVFHVGDEWFEYFYPALKPWIHYIPVEAGASQARLADLIEFAMENDGLAEEIASNGHKWAWDRLKMSDIACYWRGLLRGYAKLLRYQPKRDLELVEVKMKV